MRDDWLHRGDALQDMDLLTYAEHIERRRKPIRGDDHANSYTTSDWLGPGNGFENVMQGDHDVLKPHVGRPRCFDTMVQILYYLKWLGPGNGFENVMKGDHDVLKPHGGRPRCFDTMFQNIILPQIGLAHEIDLKML